MLCRAKEQKLAIMAPVLLTAVTKVAEDPTEVFRVGKEGGVSVQFGCEHSPPSAPLGGGGGGGSLSSISCN